MNMHFLELPKTPVGPLWIGADEEGLRFLKFGRATQFDPAPRRGIAESKADALLREVATQLQAYFDGALQVFDLPLAPQGTDFQLRVWRALCEVPYGETCSYIDLAQRAGVPKGSRAVGQANGANPLSIVIPCHRVIRADGNIGGYGGGLAIKRSLLELEQDSSCYKRSPHKAFSDAAKGTLSVDRELVR